MRLFSSACSMVKSILFQFHKQNSEKRGVVPLVCQPYTTADIPTCLLILKLINNANNLHIQERFWRYSSVLFKIKCVKNFNVLRIFTTSHVIYVLKISTTIRIMCFCCISLGRYCKMRLQKRWFETLWDVKQMSLPWHLRCVVISLITRSSPLKVKTHTTAYLHILMLKPLQI